MTDIALHAVWTDQECARASFLNRIAPGEAVAVWERFAALVAAKERDACAQVCEWMRTVPPNGEPEDVERGFNVALRRSAAAIRARGTKESA